jgi:hypothetical protein
MRHDGLLAQPSLERDDERTTALIADAKSLIPLIGEMVVHGIDKGRGRIALDC